MQRTEAGQGRASGARVQRDPDGAPVDARVVVACDRCPTELTVPRGTTFVNGVLAVRGEYHAKWTELSTQTGGGDAVKALTLCPECTRAFRLFMLGASERTTSNIGERWESVVSEAV